ncbi:hypothetical protein BU25DRAFT_456493 [Macroventuria anomochaeta]|uniref:Uncharacterized protein n=1 Tax=Macroventuria anomochaeta TaxID=301207 RepID=A0ACB6S927_9PLEO|nr:uncharacterized protein BU25DRAFT_456493 [Macroventuria anomochaeta]KAF2630085.1 hypothetical protein BU25DRAFT_456493 [Macroventuria anomochaeta]
MVSFNFTSALAAAAMMMMASAQETSDAFWGTVTTPSAIASPTTTLPASAMQTIGCFETGTPLSNYGFYEYQSPGNCQLVCIEEGKNVLGLANGVDCWCGDKIPATEWQVSNDTCSTTCAGTKDELCGGDNKLWVMLTGNTRNKVDHYEIPVDSSSSSSAKKSSTAAPSSTAAASASATPTKTASSHSDSKPNTAGIAAGVVVGVVGLAAIIGGVWFFLRRRRQRQAEEDYRRNAVGVNDFINGGKTSASSMNDSRIDPSFMDRRQSNGSIADNEDYSRRILKVTNV